MPDRAWKQTERRTAAILGGRRVPTTGRQRGDAPDVEHPWLSVECKHRKRLPAWLLDAMDQARAAARSDQLPCTVLHEAGRRHADSLVLVRLADFVEWFGSEVMPDE
jgi:hypothetical protein